MDEFEEYHQINLIGAFTQAMQESWFYRKYLSTLASLTVRTTVEYVAQNFRENGK